MSPVNDSSVSSVEEELKSLEAKLQSLSLEGSLSDAGTPTGQRVQNDIKTLLRKISESIHDGTPCDLTKIHEILRKPLELGQVDSRDDLSSLLSYLKLLSEIALQPSSPGQSSDPFWKYILEPITVDILTILNVLVFRKSFSTLSSSAEESSSGQQEKDAATCSHGTGYAFHQQLGILLKGIRILLVYLKRAVVNLPTDGGSNDSLAVVVGEVFDVLASLMDPLSTSNNKTLFDVGLDIRCNIGVGICYSIFFLTHLNQNRIQSVFRAIFDSSLQESIVLSTVYEKRLLQLAVSESNRIALAFGVLNTWLDQNVDQELYYSIAKNILDIQHGVKEAVNLGSSRILEIWTDKLARPSISIDVLKNVTPLYAPLEFFSFMYMPAHIDAVKNCCRNILSSLSCIYDRLDDEEERGANARSELSKQSRVSVLLSSILKKEPHIKWIGLACVIRNTRKSLILLHLEPSLPELLLSTQRAFQTAANDAYVVLMSYHFETVSEAKWEETWIRPLFMTQPSQNHESNWPQKKTIISAILNSERLRTPQYEVMILPLLRSVLRIMNETQKNAPAGKKQVLQNENGENLSVIESSLLAAETIKMAYELKITVDPNGAHSDSTVAVKDSVSAPEDSFRGLVPRSVLNNWLWNGNPQIRLAGFALLVDTKKTSDIISSQDFESLRLFFKYNFLSQNPAFRQQFMSYFKKFVRRLKDGESCGRRKRDTETINNYRGFIRWLWTFLTEDEGLFVGANFARRCQALECLSVLTEEFPNAFEIFGLTKSGNTKYLCWLTDSYENNKILALDIICKMPVEEFESEVFCFDLFQEAMSLCKSVKPPDSVTGRYLMTLLLRKSHVPQDYSPLNILERLFTELVSIVEKTKSTSLVQVSSESPLYGCVRCIRMILRNTAEYRSDGYALKYREYVRKLLELCFTIDDIFFPVLGSAAPEGFLPELKDPDPNDNHQVVRSLAAQMLLVCAWRTMKEVCLLMSDMCCLFVMEGESTNFSSLEKTGKQEKPGESVSYILSFDQASSIGEHLLYLLKNLMHRGVFEQVFVGFKQLSTRLWKSSASKLNSLPEKWLQDAMDQEHISAKSITRRSGGLPFIFQALLAAESHNETLIQKWVQRLLIFDETPEMTPVRIHSTNVLRGLFRDASFSAAIMPFVPHGLKMAFRGLKSADWTERNSGLMLYGAVMRRTFGAKLNLMNATTFFRKFPQMYGFLKSELDSCIQTIRNRRIQKEILRGKSGQCELVTSSILTCDFTFHLLLLLSSFTSSGMLEDTHFKLADFIPKIRKCTESDDMEVRKLAGKTLIPFLVSPEDKYQLADLIIDDISRSELSISQNIFHGLLVQLKSVIHHITMENKSIEPAVGKIASRFLSTMLTKTSMLSKAAPTIFETIMEILVHITACTLGQNEALYKDYIRLVINSFNDRFSQNFNNKRNLIPGLPIADKIIANCYIRILAEKFERHYTLEQLYFYFTDASSNSNPYIDQFLELFLESTEMHSKFTEYLFSKEVDFEEGLVVVEAVILNYLSRIKSEFSKFPGTDAELHYLLFLESVPAQFFNSIENNILSALLARLYQLCDETQETPTTLQIKAAACTVLGRVIFHADFDANLVETTRLCDLLLQWSTSDVDDDLRFAVAKCFPCIPFPNMGKLSVTNQAKLWSAILMLVQDDEGSLRSLISQKFCEPYGNTFCDRKSLEVLVQMYIQNFLKTNPVEGFLVIIGLLMREDFEVEAKAADDEAEDRLFDKSEMNMYFEHHVFAETILYAMGESQILKQQNLGNAFDLKLHSDHIELFHVLVNKNVNPINQNINSLRSFISSAKAQHNSEIDKGKPDVTNLHNLNRSNASAMRQFVNEFLLDLLNRIDSGN